MILPQEWDAQVSGQWKAIGPAVKFSDTQTSIRRQPPRLGEHTEDVLKDIGYGAEDIEELRNSGVL